MTKKPRIPHKFRPWIDARKKFHLSDAHIQMARELGLSPKRFASYADRKNKPWKLPLREFIQTQYEQKFGKPRPEKVTTIEEMAAAHVERRKAKKAAKASIKDESPPHETSQETNETAQETDETSQEIDETSQEIDASSQQTDGQPQADASSERPSED